MLVVMTHLSLPSMSPYLNDHFENVCCINVFMQNVYASRIVSSFWKMSLEHTNIPVISNIDLSLMTVFVVYENKMTSM